LSGGHELLGDPLPFLGGAVAPDDLVRLREFSGFAHPAHQLGVGGRWGFEANGHGHLELLGSRH
jgi:hypothetical protein